MASSSCSCFQGVVTALKTALPVSDRQGELVVACAGRQPGGAITDDRQWGGLADEMEMTIACEGAREQTEFRQHLKSVADAKHTTARSRETFQGVEHGCKAGDGAATQVVAVAESPRQHDGFQPAEITIFMPEVPGRKTEAPFCGPANIAVTV